MNVDENASTSFMNVTTNNAMETEGSMREDSDAGANSSFEEDEEDEEDEVDSDDEVEVVTENPVSLLQAEESLLRATNEMPRELDGDYDEETENPQEPRMKQFIEEMEYAQVFLGQVKIPERLHHKVKVQGRMNPQERDLIQYINNVLQYPPVIGRCTRFAKKTMSTYSFSIKRYVLFMANKGYTRENFEVNGIRMVECMRNYEHESRTEQGLVVPATHGVIQNFKFGLQALQYCLGIYKTRKISDGDARIQERESRWGKIPHFDMIEQYAIEAKRRRYIVAKENNYDKTRPEMDKSGYLDEQLKEMMVAMYEKTRSSKQNVIYDGINTILELLLGHHLLFRSRNKRNLELSDSVYTVEDTAQGKVPVLGFKFTEGKTLDASTPPQQMGACRNKDVEVCLVSAFAMSLWYRFDFKDQYGLLAGSRAPDFMNKENWYPIKVLWTKSAKSMKEKQPISYNYEALLVRQCLKTVGLQSLKKTHLGRVVSARKADAKRIEECQIRRAGKWRTDSVQNSYLSPYPFEFLHHTGGFEETERYFLPRDIEPPEELQQEIFPWLEGEIAKLEERGDQLHLSIVERDRTAIKFLQMLKQFRSVIIQDLAVMKDISPGSIFSQHEITRKSQFLAFKARVEERVRNLSVFDGIRDQPNVVDFICPAFMLKLETLKCGIDMSSCVVSEKLKALEDTIQKQQSISAEREGKSSKLSRAMMNDLINLALGSQIMALETHYKEIRDSLVKQENTMMLLFDRFAALNVASGPSLNNSSVQETDQPASLSGNAGAQQVSPEERRARLNATKMANICRTFPGWQLMKSTVTIPQLIEEWYVPRGRIPVVEQRNALAGAKWRDSASFYKRRKAVIDFIEDMVRVEAHDNPTRLEVANILQAYMVLRNMQINGLGTRLLDVDATGGKTPQKRVVTQDFKARWDAAHA